MAIRWIFDVTNRHDRAIVSVEANFTDEEEEKLRAYDQYAEELRELSILKHGAPGEMQLHWREGEGLTVTTKLPPNEQLFTLLHCLRPFVLEEEDTHFFRVARNIGHRAKNDLIRMFLRIQRNLYESKHSQQLVKITSNETVINCEATLQKWLNAHEYHRDKDKRSELADLHQLLPFEASRAIFVMMLYDKADAIRNLQSLVRLILGKQNTWGWSSAQGSSSQASGEFS